MALKDSQGYADTRSQTYIEFSVTDGVYGSMTFRLGDVAFSHSNAYTGLPVSPCVVSWGNLVKYMPTTGNARQNQAVIRLAATAYVVATTAADRRFKVYEVFQNLNLRDLAVSIYQWNAGETTQEVIWKGYWGGVVGYSFEGGIAVLDVSLSSDTVTNLSTIGEVVSRNVGTYADAPDDVFGLMNVKGYGSLVSTTDVALEDSVHKLSPMALGYATRSGPTIVIDESTVPGYGRYRSCQNDGTSAAKTTGVGALGSGTVGKWWVYDPNVGAYAHIESSGIVSSSNDATSNYADVSNSPPAFFVLRPTLKHSSTSAGITDPQPPINDDATDYVTLTEANPVLAYECPNVSLPSGAEIVETRIAVEIYRTFSGIGAFGVKVGVWDPYTGGGQYWGSANHYQLMDFDNELSPHAKRHQLVTTGTGGAGAWGVWAAESANSTGTLSEFSRGQFVGIDTGSSNNRKPLVTRLEWSCTAASGHTFRVYSVAFLVKVVYPKVKVGTKPLKVWTGWTWDNGGEVTFREDYGHMQDVMGVPNTTPGIDVIWNGEYQKDDGSGTYTGSASALIQKVPDICNHLVNKIGGKSRNTTSGTLGNFIDPRTEETAGELSLSPIFGTDQVTLDGALQQIQSRWPCRVYIEDGIYRYVPNEMNPHSSRLYRSSADRVYIEAFDIIDGTFRVEERDARSIVNSVTVNVGHSYGRNSPTASFTYNHPLSQAYFGVSQERVIDEPWITVADLATGAPEAAKYLARFHGRTAARPRLKVAIGLVQKFYDLQPGHIIEFGGTMETAGIYCPAYRCGRLDYAYPSTTAANQADDTTPTLVAGGASNREAYFGTSQQTDRLTFSIDGAGSYTDNANPWQYYDGSAWQNLTGVTCSDGGASASVFERTGTITVSWTRPTATSWKKAELTLNSASRGPVYWVRHNCDTVVVACTGNAITTYPATWYGRLFEVLETNRRVGANGYPYMEAVLEEVM